MPMPILTTTSTIMCPHGGTVMLTTSNTLMRIQEAPALLVNDLDDSVVGCPFTIPGTPPVYSPCVKVRWSAGATQIKVYGTPVLLQTSVGTCYSGLQAPQGKAVISQVQQVAKGL
jgi:hypothetical protein